MLEIETLEEKRLIKVLVMFTVAIILLNIINRLLGESSWQISRLIRVGMESNLPTWFSSMMLAMAAFFAYRCSLVMTKKEGGRRMFQLLTLGLLGMSCDEVSQIHENLGKTINKYYFHLKNINSSWVILLGPFVLIFLIIFSLKIRKHLAGSVKAVKFLTLGFFIYITGAFLLEATSNFLNHLSLEWLWQIETLLEESFEMIGIILIIKGLQEHYMFLVLGAQGPPIKNKFLN